VQKIRKMCYVPNPACFWDRDGHDRSQAWPGGEVAAGEFDLEEESLPGAGMT